MGVPTMFILLLSTWIVVSACQKIQNSTRSTIKIGLKKITQKHQVKYFINVDGCVVLKGHRHWHYYGDIGVGTPMQNFKLFFDTGSSDLWVFNSDWVRGNDKRKYESSQSSTYKMDGESAKLDYQDTAIEGFMSEDCITIGQMVVQEQRFIECTNEREGHHRLESESFDGIFGLGFQKNSVKDSVPLWDNMRTQGLLEQNIFSIWLKYYNKEDEENEDRENGVIIFGGFDEAHFKGEHTYVPVEYKSFWEFKMKAIHIGGNQTDHCAEGCLAIIDSGNSLVRGTASIINSINRAIGVNDLVVLGVDCKKISSMPTISFTIGGKTFPILPKDYIDKQSDGKTCASLFRPNRYNTEGEIDDGDTDDGEDVDDGDTDDGEEVDDDLWILGHVFMKLYHIVFDFGESRIGFAESVKEN